MKIILKSVLCVAAALFLIGAPSVALAQTDDFNDGDDAGWTHLSGLTASTGQVWDASTGQYHLTAPENGFSSYGYIGSHVGPSMTNVNVMADIVNFTGPPAGAVFGVAARLDGNDGFNALKGYAYAYEPFAASGAGEMVLYRITGLSLSDIGSQQVTLDPNKDYTFVLDIQGTQLHGQVFEIGGGMVAEKFAVDGTYASGFSGLIAYSRLPCRRWTLPGTTSRARCRNRPRACSSPWGRARSCSAADSVARAEIDWHWIRFIGKLLGVRTVSRFGEPRTPICLICRGIGNVHCIKQHGKIDAWQQVGPRPHRSATIGTAIRCRRRIGGLGP